MSTPAGKAAPPLLIMVKSPSGTEVRVPVKHSPFRIGRHADNDVVLRDSRVSRYHAQITASGAVCFIEDLKSRLGVFVNGQRVQRAELRDGDKVEFGAPDSYVLTFRSGAPKAAQEPVSTGAGGGSLAKLRATLEVARALEASLSTDEVLAAVVDAALTVTGCERGFLLMRKGDDLEIRVARSRSGALAAADLRVPTRLLLRALNQRREFFSMNFDPENASPGAAAQSIHDLELRSVVCLPLVRIRTGSAEETASLSVSDTAGLLYMDSRLRSADLSAGGRELLTTLALEASTVLENARLLEEQWARQRMEQELRIARRIQESLMPRSLPAGGWLRAAVSSVPSLQVGGDYADLRPVDRDCWAFVEADVSGKGVGAALLASLLQGMFLASPCTRLSIESLMTRANRFLNERTGGEQYATVFYATLGIDGCLRWVNAGHPPPLLVKRSGALETLPANGTPLGMLEEAEYETAEKQLEPFDKLLVYTDGVTEARNGVGEFFGGRRLREAVLAHGGGDCGELQAGVLEAVHAFTAGEPQHDDLTLMVVEYSPEGDLRRTDIG